MALIHDVSAPCVKCEYDLFSMPPTQKNVDRGYYTEYRSVATISPRSPLVFNIPASSDEYIDLEQTQLYIEVEITGTKKSDGSALLSTDGVKITTSNNLLHALFQQIDLSLNDKVVTVSTNTYGYRAYFGNLFETTQAVKNSRLSTEMWLHNQPKTNFETLDDSNLRGMAILGGKKLAMFGRLHLDLAQQPKQLPPGINVQITMTPNKPEFYLLADIAVNSEIKIVDAFLLVRKTQLFHQPKLAHELALTKATAKYPITRKEVRTFTIARGMQHISMDNIITGQLPRRMIVGFVDQDGFSGVTTKDPFKFEHKKINFIAAYIDGQQIPSKAYTPDFDKGLVVREYFGLFQAFNQTGVDTTFDISLQEYKLGYALFGFNFSPDLSDGPIGSGHYDLIKRGSLRIEAKFAEALTDAVVAIIYVEFDSLIEINRDRVVTTDYN